MALLAATHGSPCCHRRTCAATALAATLVTLCCLPASARHVHPGHHHALCSASHLAFKLLPQLTGLDGRDGLNDPSRPHLVQRAEEQEKRVIEMFAALPELHPQGGTVLQIGANTGKNTDFWQVNVGRYDNRWRKVLVEPIPTLFSQLTTNMADVPNATFVNAAIAPDNGDSGGVEDSSTADMWCLRMDEESGKAKLSGDAAEKGEVPGWANQLCSFNKDKVVSATNVIAAATEEDVVKVEVESLTVAQLVHKYDVHNVAVVLIDAEGYDYEVLKQVLSSPPLMLPLVVVYEDKNLEPAAAQEALELMHRHCYLTVQDHSNIIGFSLLSMQAT